MEDVPDMVGGLNDLTNNCSEDDPNVEELVPKAGMTFNSDDELRSFYDKYAYQVGFGVRRASVKGRADGEKRYYALTCAKGGKYVSSAKNSLYLRPTIKTDCKARINVIVYNDGRCTISGVYLDHNHDLSPKKSRFQRSHKKMDSHSKRRLALNDQAGIPLSKNYQSLVVEAGGYENLAFGEKECRNHIAKVRKLRLGTGDAEALRDYFVRMQQRNSNFFHVIDIDDDGHIRNIFWADARSRAAYESFGDVVSFDSTYLTNRYNMPFAPFVGVNHHGQSILFGCGLISTEDVQTYTWLFESWLQCMRGRHPNAIITDQCRSIRAAVAKVFPQSHHRFCLWHIMRKIPEKLGGYSQYKAIKKRLKIIVYESTEPTEFDDGWVRMVEDFNLEKNEWLSSLFSDRNQWAPVFVKKIFWAGMSTTQRSESMNAFFDDYVNAKTSLKQFVEQYDQALKSKAEKEIKADYDSLNSMYTVITGCHFEKQFQEAYTNNIFKLFQDEIRGVLFCNFSLRHADCAVSIFNVSDILKSKDGQSEKRVQYNVLFNENECDIRCSCQLFEFKGIMCRHMVKILIEKKVTQIPPLYILTRWRKDVKHPHYYVKNCYRVGEISEHDKQYEKMYAKFFQVAEVANTSRKKYEFFMKYMDEGEKKLKDDTYWSSTQINQVSEGTGCEASSNGIILSPVQVRSKGRPPVKRKLSTLERKTNKKKKKDNKSGKKDDTREDQVLTSGTTLEQDELSNLRTTEAYTPNTIDGQSICRSHFTQNQEVFMNRQMEDDQMWKNLNFTQLLQDYGSFDQTSTTIQFFPADKSGNL